MRSPKCLCFGIVCALAGWCLSTLAAEEVINEDFEGGAPAGLGIVGTAQVIDDGCGNQVLSLTQGINNQGGWAWFPDQFDLSAGRVEIEFDIFIGQGTTTPPADGVSVIFQFDGNLSATGDAGGGLGVGNLNGNEYVSVGFDIWDNDGAPGPGGASPIDVETACDSRYGTQSSSHIEVDQNIDPEGTASQAAAEGPDFIGSAALYRTTAGGGSCDPADLVHIKIVFDNRLMLVKASGGIGCDGSPYPETEVISYATQPFPAELSNIGFAASTGSANAHQWIDNLVVREDVSKVTFVKEDLLTQGGMNCGGGAVDATAEVGASFRADGLFGTEASRSGSIDTVLTIVMNRLGRIASGADYTNVNANPIDLSKIPGAGAQMAAVMADHAWSTSAVRYRAEVQPGRYEVKLYWAENYGPAIDATGRGTKLYDVYLAGQKVLCNWSAAAAAGSPTTSGDPRVPCFGTLDKAVGRTFAVDVDDGGGGVGTLDIVVDDLGGGNPPENAALDALSFKRLGNAEGGAPSGDLECNKPSPGAAPPGVLISADFDADEDGACPEGMQCTKLGGGAWTAQVQAGRLRAANDTAADADSQTVACFDQTVDVLGSSLMAEFDIFMAWTGDPADGGSFFVLQGAGPVTPGPGGGGYLGIPTNAYGFAVEFDTYRWCCFNAGNDDVSGMSDALAPYPHVAINNLSTDSTMPMVRFDSNLKPVANGGTGWPDFLDPGGVHVKVTYAAGSVEVELTGVEADGATPFGPTVVARADVTPIWAPEAVAGFTGATGGLFQTIEFDNVEISAAQGRPPSADEDPLASAIASARERWQTKKELYINCGGPVLLCNNPVQFPAPQATGDAGPGESVTWLGDQATGAGPYTGEFFTVTSLNDPRSRPGLNVAGTDMGAFDARGTSPGVDDADAVFHTERYASFEYGIPVPDQGPWELTLYFANSWADVAAANGSSTTSRGPGTAGTARCGFHVDIEGERKGGFNHCHDSGKSAIGTRTRSRWVKADGTQYDKIFDPVDAAEQLYSSDSCNFASCGQVPGCIAVTDPDLDQIAANLECGNAAAVALRYQVTVADGVLNVALTPPGTGEPGSPNANPKISGITLWPAGSMTPENCNNGNVDDDGDQLADCADPDCASAPNCQGGKLFHRGDPNNDGAINITDGIYILNFLFLGGPKPTCMESANPNDDASVNITDGIYVLNFLFLGGPPPTAPGPTANPCGLDPTGAGKTDLGCETYTKC